jgi:hypothetical protein
MAVSRDQSPSGGFLVVFARVIARPRRAVAHRFQLGTSGTCAGQAGRRDDRQRISSGLSAAGARCFYGFAFGSPPDTPRAPAGLIHHAHARRGESRRSAIPGPVIEEVRHTPNVPLDNEDLHVTARAAFVPSHWQRHDALSHHVQQ